MKGADLLKEYFKELNIQYIFGVIGREAEHITFDDKNFKFVLMHNEQNAGIAAEAYSRFKNRPQVCWSTMGPGFTNLLTGIASAYKEKFPLLAISAQAETTDCFPTTHQYLPSSEIVSSIVKYSYEPKTIDELIDSFKLCSKYLNTKPYGPCHLSIPIDVLEMDVDTKFTLLELLNVNEAESVRQISSTDVEVVHSILRKSKSPLIICGEYALRGDLPKNIKKLAERYSIPVATTLGGKGVISDSNDLCLGAISPYYKKFLDIDITSEFFTKVDTIFLIEYCYSEGLSSKIWEDSSSKQVITLNSFDFGLENIFSIDRKIICENIDDFINIFNEKEIFKKCNLKDLNFIKEKKKVKICEERDKERSIIGILDVIRENLSDTDLFIVDVGLNKHLAGIFFDVYSPLSYIGSNGLATMGFSIPAGIGAKLANPESKVICFSGDGGSSSVISELETCVRLKLDIVVIILNNGRFGLIDYYHEKNPQNKEVDTNKFGKISFKKIADGMGCVGNLIESNQEFSSVFQSALKSKDVNVIEVPFYY